MNKRESLQLLNLKLTLGETSCTSKPKIMTFEVAGQSLEENMEENTNQSQKRPIDQAIWRIKLREYSYPYESQT